MIAGLLAIALWFLTSIATDTAVDNISDPALREPAHVIVDRLTAGLSTQMLAIAGVAAAAIVIALIVARFEPEPF
jgi:dipeptide/tripeptide permease